MTTQSQPRAAGQAAHTPTPWTAWPSALNLAHVPCISGPDGWNIGTFRDHSTNDRATENANAAFAVRCVNSHAALVEALEDCNGVLDSVNRHTGGTSIAVRAVLEKVRAALKAAKE